MQKIIIASLTEEENFTLKKKLEPLAQIFDAIHFQTATPQNVHNFIDHRVSLVILNLHHFKPSEKDPVRMLRKSGYVGPIVLTARLYNPDFLQGVERAENIFVLEKPYDEKDLIGVTYKYLRTKSVKQRIFRRYKTEQHAEAQSYAKDDPRKVKVFNLSKGGACIEGEFDESFKEGALLRLRFHLNELDREYTVPARVVWKKKNDEQEGYSVGVAFVRTDDVYKYLLNSF